MKNISGDQDFSEEINRRIFAILKNETRKQAFPEENIFKIFEYIFLNDSPGQKEALDILADYVTYRRLLPKTTRTSIENMSGRGEFSSQALDVLGKVIQNGQEVEESTLKIFADNLYLSDNENVRVQSYDLLEIADNNQDLADDIFEILELERAGVALRFEEDRAYAAHYIEKMTKEGTELSIGVLKALSRYPNSTIILHILNNVTENKQKLPEYLLDRLVERFNPEGEEVEIVEIFNNVAKNNQNISEKLVPKLRQALDNQFLTDKALLIFTLQAQKGEKTLPHSLVNRICKGFLNNPDRGIKQECLSAVCSIIQTHDSIKQELVEKVLKSGLQEANPYIVSNCVNGFVFMHEKNYELSTASINSLFEKVRDAACPENLKKSILTILRSYSLSPNQERVINLLSLEYSSEEDILNKLEVMFSGVATQLLDQNFNQLGLILGDSPPHLQKKALELLFRVSSKQAIPMDLMDSIGTLMVRNKKSMLPLDRRNSQVRQED